MYLIKSDSPLENIGRKLEIPAVLNPIKCHLSNVILQNFFVDFIELNTCNFTNIIDMSIKKKKFLLTKWQISQVLKSSTSLHKPIISKYKYIKVGQLPNNIR